MRVAALCVNRRSAYHGMESVECFDAQRDAWTFQGSMPVVAHPPCRGWSEHYKHLAKVEDGELELGLQCCNWLRQWGGVLEQPAKSGLFAAGRLPVPGERRGILWTVEVLQQWWGFPTRKRTWLCFSRVNAAELSWPFRLGGGGDGLRFERLSKRQRSETTPALAAWLVDAARMAGVVNAARRAEMRQ